MSNEEFAANYTLPQIRRDRVFTSSAAAGQVQVKRIHPAKLAQRRRDYKRANMEEAGARPANVPVRHYDLDDRIELARPTRPASMRQAVPGVNVPAEGETWQDLAAWRSRYGLPPVNR